MTEVPPRSPCPCGSGRRYKACHGSARRPEPVLRPFAGRDDEPDWVALRELVPSATAPLTLSAGWLAEHPGHADRRITLGTVLPETVPALVREDGEVLLGLQSPARGTDISVDFTAALVAALDAEPGGVVEVPAAPPGTPRLVDLLDPAPLTITVHPGFDWWIPPPAPGDTASPEVAATLERANASVVPTARLTGVEAAYWCEVGDRRHLRWAMSDPEDPLVDALARLAAAGELTVGPGSRYAGAFRALGCVVPVWDLAADATAAECEAPSATLRGRLTDLLAQPGPLTAAERRARAGLVGRTLTLR